MNVRVKHTGENRYLNNVLKKLMIINKFTLIYKYYTYNKY